MSMRHDTDERVFTPLAVFFGSNLQCEHINSAKLGSPFQSAVARRPCVIGMLIPRSLAASDWEIQSPSTRALTNHRSLPCESISQRYSLPSVSSKIQTPSITSRTVRVSGG